ncbi:MAG: hypothetical protein AAGF12_15240 [Myxococcota bacterium]
MRWLLVAQTGGFVLFLGCGGADARTEPMELDATPDRVVDGSMVDGSMVDGSMVDGSVDGETDAAARLPGVVCPDAPIPTDPAPDGTPLPPDVAMALNAAVPSVADALASADSARVNAEICEVREALGEWQGVAETAAEYRQAPASPPDAAAIGAALGLGLEQRFIGAEPWTRAGLSTNGDDVSEPLRGPCELIDWYLRVAETDPTRRDMFRSAARGGLDWLLSIQRDTGAFPYPNLSDDADAYLMACQSGGGARAECEASLPRAFELALIGVDRWRGAGSPDGVLVDGWFVDLALLDPGGLQFDTGICGRTMLGGYRAFSDERYLASAVSAGRWAQGSVSVPNFNYNAFSVGLLAALDEAQPEAGWAEAALEKARIGVLPGALPNGRWADPHNARIVYHMILLRGLVRLSLRITDPWIEATVDVAVARVERELGANGVTATADGIETLLLVQDTGRDVSELLNRMVNASAPNGVPNTGALAYWLAP